MCCNSRLCQCPNKADNGFRLDWNFGFDLTSPSKCTCETSVFKCIPAQCKTVGHGKKRELVETTMGNLNRISRPSWTETSSLYPCTPSNIYWPQNWDTKLLSELLEARASIHLVCGQRNEKYKSKPQKPLPNLKNVDRISAKYHLIDNFPPIPSVIRDNKDIRWIGVYKEPDHRHVGINKSQKIVKAYGPFHNTTPNTNEDWGPPVGPAYIIFYSAKD